MPQARGSYATGQGLKHQRSEAPSPHRPFRYKAMKVHSREPRRFKASEVQSLRGSSEPCNLRTVSFPALGLSRCLSDHCLLTYLLAAHTLSTAAPWHKDLWLQVFFTWPLLAWWWWWWQPPPDFDFSALCFFSHAFSSHHFHRHAFLSPPFPSILLSCTNMLLLALNLLIYY